MADSKDKKFMDVAKNPEEATADIGAKPMIVGHKMANDPMLKEEENVEKNPEKAESSPMVPPSQKQKQIAPLPKQEETTTADAASDSKAKEPVIAEKQPSTEDEKAAEEPKIDPVAAGMEKEEELRKMISSKKYFVSIKQARNSNPFMTILALFGVLLVGLSVVFYLVDTDKLDLGFELPFSLFNKKEPTTTILPTATPENTVQESKAEPVEALPADTDETVAYANATFGVNFEYPASWGTVKVEQINGYADQTYENEQPYFLDVTFSAKKEVEVRIVNGRAFEGGRDFLGPFGEADLLISFYHAYSLSYKKLAVGSYELTRFSNEDVSKTVSSDPLTTSLYTFNETENTLRIEPKWTLENLEVLPWDVEANDPLTQKEAEAQLLEKNKRVMLVRNYTSEKVFGANASYVWTGDKKDTATESALVSIINSVQ